MQPRIAIVDYHLSNLFSVQQACLHLGYEAVVTADPAELRNASALILPGVGSFPTAMQRLEDYGLVEVLLERINAGVPFLGICLGLQLLFTQSEEFGITKGFDVIPGRVVHLETGLDAERHPIPFIGWNEVYARERDFGQTALRDLEGRTFYAVHSFYVEPQDASCSLSFSKYGGFEYCTSVQKDNIFATQFHPEKSGPVGLLVMERWLEGIR